MSHQGNFLKYTNNSKNSRSLVFLLIPWERVPIAIGKGEVDFLEVVMKK
jgi:hypothetical protein